MKQTVEMEQTKLWFVGKYKKYKKKWKIIETKIKQGQSRNWNLENEMKQNETKAETEKQIENELKIK